MNAQPNSDHFPGRIYVQKKDPWGVYESDYDLQKRHYAAKLAEIDYMLGLIEKEEVEETAKVLFSGNLSGLKTELIKRLGDFAEAETHRDFNCEY